MAQAEGKKKGTESELQTKQRKNGGSQRGHICAREENKRREEEGKKRARGVNLKEDGMFTCWTKRGEMREGRGNDERGASWCGHSDIM